MLAPILRHNRPVGPSVGRPTGGVGLLGGEVQGVGSLDCNLTIQSSHLGLGGDSPILLRQGSPGCRERSKRRHRGNQSAITVAQASQLVVPLDDTRRAQRLLRGGIENILGRSVRLGYEQDQGNDCDLRVAYLNVNGLKESNLLIICAFMLDFAIDVLFLIDVRLSVANAAMFGRILQAGLGVGSKVQCTTQDPGMWIQSDRHGEAGGIMSVVGTRWGEVAGTLHGDPSGLGVAAQLILHGGQGDILLVATYWPWKGDRASEEDGDTALWTAGRPLDGAKPASAALRRRLREWRTGLASSGIGVWQGAWDYVQQTLEGWLLKHGQRHSGLIVVGGDFNLEWSTVGPRGG